MPATSSITFYTLNFLELNGNPSCDVASNLHLTLAPGVVALRRRAGPQRDGRAWQTMIVTS